MLPLNLTTDKLSVITSSGADIDVVVGFVDAPDTILPGSNMGPDRQLTKITTATTTDIQAVPGGSEVRNTKFINLYNIDGATSNVVTLQVDANGTLYILGKCTLLAGEWCIWHEGVFFHYDSNGSVYGTGIPYAVQADVEAATSSVLVVSPAMLQYHPGVAKCWVEGTANSTTILASYNITSLADTATGTQTVTIATDFSSANWSCMVTRSEDDLTLVYSATYNAKTAGVVAMNSAVEAGSGSDPTSSSGNASWSMVGFGDQ